MTPTHFEQLGILTVLENPARERVIQGRKQVTPGILPLGRGSD